MVTAEIGGEGDRRKVETRIWLQILSLESTIFAKLNGALGAEHGLSVAKFEFLAQVARYPDGVSLGQISANLKVTSGNVSGLVRRLQADGLITRKMSPEDRRSFIVRFTPEGEKLFEKANALHARTLSECFTALAPAELEDALTALRVLASGVQDHQHA